MMLMIEQETKEAGLIRYALSSLFDPLRNSRMSTYCGAIFLEATCFGMFADVFCDDGKRE
jgi:hypothetical protein